MQFLSIERLYIFCICFLGNVPSEVLRAKIVRSCCNVNRNSEELSSGSCGAEEYELSVKRKEEKGKTEVEASELSKINEKCDNKASTSFSEGLKTKRGISEGKYGFALG